MKEKVVDYITKSEKAGLTEKEIREKLASIGLTSDEICTAYEDIKRTKDKKAMTETQEYCPKCGQQYTPWDTRCWKCGFDRSGKKTITEIPMKPAIAAFAAIALLAFAFYAIQNINLANIEEKIVEHVETSSKIVDQRRETTTKTQGNKLLVGGEQASPIRIEINPLVELDYKTKNQIYELRKSYVEEHSSLIDGTYQPSDNVFGQIEDSKPWWGIRGQFCDGNGEKSIDGLSEESRFMANPFLLLGVDEGTAYIIHGPCEPIFPMPKHIIWDKTNSKAEVTYGYSEFIKEKKTMPVFDIDAIKLDFVSYNARDFGYNYIYVNSELSYGVEPTERGQTFSQAVELKNYIHTGGSCGYPGGCNNASPDQP
ncbi:MAG: hypothetical protein KKD39_02735, partial [Candidatus Altiarchaeota archaeon]|nr:hypothetical protein [Candidatus Altiarchaeota archaeon]